MERDSRETGAAAHVQNRIAWSEDAKYIEGIKNEILCDGRGVVEAGEVGFLLVVKDEREIDGELFGGAFRPGAGVFEAPILYNIAGKKTVK